MNDLVQDRWTRTDAGELFYAYAPRRTATPSIPVVLVHGLVVSSRYMRPLAARLSAHHDVYAPDLPAYGRTAREGAARGRRATPDVVELADALADWMAGVRLERAAFVGNSYGCQVLSEFAARHPGRADRMVLVGPTMDPAARTAWKQMVRTLRANGREPLSYMPIMARDYFDAGSGTALRSFRYALAHAIEERLPEIRVPVLVVRGSRDPIVPQRWAEEVARLLPRGSLKVIPGGAHALNYGWALELARVVRPFLRDAGTAPPLLEA